MLCSLLLLLNEVHLPLLGHLPLDLGLFDLLQLCIGEGNSSLVSLFLHQFFAFELLHQALEIRFAPIFGLIEFVLDV